MKCSTNLILLRSLPAYCLFFDIFFILLLTEDCIFVCHRTREDPLQWWQSLKLWYYLINSSPEIRCYEIYTCSSQPVLSVAVGWKLVTTQANAVCLRKPSEHVHQLWSLLILFANVAKDNYLQFSIINNVDHVYSLEYL